VPSEARSTDPELPLASDVRVRSGYIAVHLGMRSRGSGALGRSEPMEIAPPSANGLMTAGAEASIVVLGMTSRCASRKAPPATWLHSRRRVYEIPV